MNTTSVFVLLLVLALVSCCMVLLCDPSQQHGAFHYTQDKTYTLGKSLKEIGDKPFKTSNGSNIVDIKFLREFINYVRQAKGVPPLAPATTAQITCAEKIAAAVNENLGKELELGPEKSWIETTDAALDKPYGNCGEQGTIMFIFPAGIDGLTFYDIIDTKQNVELMLDKKFKTVACGAPGGNCYRINFYT